MSIITDKLTPIQKYYYSYDLLRKGNYREGFKFFEYRWHPAVLASLPKPYVKLSKAPTWCGQSLLGKSIVVQMEMGYGDCIMWSRYLPLLKTYGAKQVVVVQTKSLHNLIAQFQCVDYITNKEDSPDVQDVDYWIGSISLSYFALYGPSYVQALFPTAGHNVFGREGYLDAQAKELKGDIKIGINWKCSVGSHQEMRSLTEGDLRYIKNELPQVTFYSLNPDIDLPFNPLPTTDWKKDWSITASYMKSMNYVISVDTGTVHLAGALGVPCLMLHPPDPYICWRWSSNAWYSSVKTFKQPHVEKAVKYLKQKLKK